MYEKPLPNTAENFLFISILYFLCSRKESTKETRPAKSLFLAAGAFSGIPEAALRAVNTGIPFRKKLAARGFSRGKTSGIVSYISRCNQNS
jgi:hypothetical protein